MDLVLGVDGGNSKAVALVARRDGSIIGAARRPGSADIYAGEETALELLHAVAADALADAGASPTDVGAAAFSLAGADWPEDIALLESSLDRRFGPGAPVTVVNDAIGALAGAVPEGPAVVVSLGTGAATGARAADGSTWHSSFWQMTQGATELAHGALDGMVRSELGIEPAPLLRERVLEAIGDAEVETALHRMTRRQGGAEKIGAVVRALFEAADAGDPVAARIVVTHGIEIGEVAAAAARRVGIDREPYALAFGGGVARAGAARLIAAATDAIASAGQSPRPTAPRWEPAVGALLIGLRALSDVGDLQRVADHLDATMPSASLFGPGP